MISHLLRPVIFAGLAVAFAIASCSNKPEKLVDQEDKILAGEKEPAKAADFSQELHGVKYTQSRDGKTQWELVANSVHQVADGPAKLMGVKITYYADDGKIVVLTADTGAYEASTRNISLEGNVVVNTSDGNHLNTDALKWSQKSETLNGEGDVTMTRGGSVIRGKGFELSPESETINIYEASGTVRQKEMNLKEVNL